MRQILFFDLPVKKASDRKAYTQFLKSIKTHGFYMLQESVYIKLNIDMRSADATIHAISLDLPPKGNIMVINITETQFAKMEILLGKNTSDVINTDQRYIEL